MNILKKYFGWIVGGIVLIVIAVSLLVYNSNQDAELTDAQKGYYIEKYNLDPLVENAAGEVYAQEKMLGVSIPLTIALIILAAIFVTVFSAKDLAKDRKTLIRALVTRGGVVVFVLIMYLTASTDSGAIDTKVAYGESELRIAGAIYNTTQILLIVGVLALVGIKALKLVKNSRS